MHPVLLAWLTRLLWTPKKTRLVMGLPRSIADRIEPSLEALTAHAHSELVEEVVAEAHDALRDGLAERHIPDGTYVLALGSDPIITARVVRPLDGRSWTLREFDDFIDLGLNPQGSELTTDA